MNRSQRIVMGVGLLLIAFSFAFPWSHYPQLIPNGTFVTRPDFFAFDRPQRTVIYSWVAFQVLALGALTASGYLFAGYRSAGADRSLEREGRPN